MSYASFASLPCTLGRPAALLGERWTLLLLRQVFLGTRRFEDFHLEMDISRSVLTDRLSMLSQEGVLKRVPYQEDGRTRYEYRLTEKGKDLYLVLMALRTWGEKWMVPEEGDESFSLEHHDCGGGVRAKVECTDCGAELTARDVRVTART